MALIKTKLIKPPSRGDWTKSAKNQWRRQFARYLLYVIQKTKLLQLKPEHKSNLLYQVGYNKNLSLANVFDEQEMQVLVSLPYYLVLTKLTSEQLTMLAHKLGIKIPKKCTKTRAALLNVVTEAYDAWYEMLNKETSTMIDLYSSTVRDISFNFQPNKV